MWLQPKQFKLAKVKAGLSLNCLRTANIQPIMESAEINVK